MLTPARDLEYLTAGLAALETYLLSDDLFFLLDGTLPRLTISGMLLAEKRMSARGLPGQTETYSLQMDVIRMKWRSAWKKKAEREFHARITQWKNAMQEILEPGEESSYSQQVQWRVMLKLLSGEFKLPPDASRLLSDLDFILESRWRSGKFIWDIDLSKAFTIDDYWFLYGKVKMVG